MKGHSDTKISMSNDSASNPVSNKPGRKGLKRIIWASLYSVKGIRAAWTHEAAFRQELCLMLLLLPAAFWLGQTALEQIILILPLFLVVIIELINSAIEAVVDRISDEQHKLSGRAKDMGSAAVMFSLLLTVICWTLVAWQRFG